MKTTTAPALLPAVSLALGVAASLAGSVPPGLALALCGLSSALGAVAARRATLALGLGLLLPTLAAGPLAERVVREPLAGQPAEILGRVAAPWVLRGGVRSAAFDASLVIQRGRITFGPRRWLLQLPEEVPAPAVGSLLRVQGTAGRSLGTWNRRRLPEGPWRLAVKSSRLVRVEQGPGSLQRLTNAVRARLERALAALPAERLGSALARAMVLGDVSALPGPFARGLKRLGLSHVLSVSGLHMSLLALAVFRLARPLGRAPRLLFGMAGIALYSLLVGAQPAAWRAALMALLFFLSLLGERPPSAANAVAVAVILLLASEPRLLLDLGFQLSVAATAALIFLAPRLAARWQVMPVWLARPLAATAAAQLATLPLALPRFFLIPFLAPVANLVLVPWAGVILIVDLAWAATALALPSVAAAAGPLLDGVAAPLAWAAGWQGSRAWLGLAAPSLLMTTGVSIALVWILLCPRRPVLLLAAALVAALALRPNAEAGTGMVFLDVGQGDATLLRSARKTVLIDGGGWAAGDFAGAVLIPALAGEGVRRLDAVALTHGDSDHCQGLLGLADYMAFGELWLATGALESSCARQLAELHAGPLRRLGEGAKLRVGEWSFEVLSPPFAPGRPGLEGNDGSLVLRARAGEIRVLLTGDIERRGELELALRQRARLAAEILKVPHHGSHTSSTARFLAAVGARYAVISAGRGNRYGHPSSEVLERLGMAGARVLRTDRDGAVRLTLAGAGRVRVETTGPP